MTVLKPFRNLWVRVNSVIRTSAIAIWLPASLPLFSVLVGDCEESFRCTRRTNSGSIAKFKIVSKNSSFILFFIAIAESGQLTQLLGQGVGITIGLLS